MFLSLSAICLSGWPFFSFRGFRLFEVQSNKLLDFHGVGFVKSGVEFLEVLRDSETVLLSEVEFGVQEVVEDA